MLNEDIKLKLDASIKELITKHAIACEELDAKQLAEALKQALQAGDFQKLVIRDGGQAIIYLPYRECEKLRQGVEDLKAALFEIGELVAQAGSTADNIG